jgi:iron complex transport system permease protein
MKRRNRILITLGVIALLSVLFYLFFWMITTPFDLFPADPEKAARMRQAIFNIIQRKGIQVLAMVVSAILISSTSLVFQTLTQNRILTPSLIGFDAIFVTVQTAIVFFFTASSIVYLNAYVNFAVASTLMVLISILMYTLILKKNKNNIIFLLLVGMVLSTLSRSLASFLQTVMDPEEFQSLTIRTEVSIANMNTSIIMIAVPLMLFIVYMLIREFRSYDVMTLGESQATGLGVSYAKKMHGALIYIALAMSISTAMIGPISFLGLIAVNAAREMLKDYKHFPLFIASSLISIIFIVFGQGLIAETGYLTTVTVLINMVGGAYMIYLVLKENKA